VFRAEPHDTPRHLSEYVSLDAEIGFIADHADVMAIARQAVAGMVANVEERGRDAAALLRVDLPRVPAEIPAVHFADAQAMIGASTGEGLEGEPDLAPAHERWIGDWARREHDSDFVFVTGYPMAKRPFYTHPDPARPEFSNSFDLLFRGLELATGGQRLHRYEDVPRRARRSRRGPADLRVLPAGIPVRHAAARRVCDRPGALGQPPYRRGQRARDDALSS
jgi:nondiscriminating aspartyl-tRNA synthetase